jgi:hypothetical protein
VFDDERLAMIHCDERDGMLGAEIATDPGEVAVLCAAFHDAWGRSLARSVHGGHHLR